MKKLRKGSKDSGFCEKYERCFPSLMEGDVYKIHILKQTDLTNYPNHEADKAFTEDYWETDWEHKDELTAFERCVELVKEGFEKHHIRLTSMDYDADELSGVSFVDTVSFEEAVRKN